MKRQGLTVRYAAFAAIATVVNVTMQHAVLQFGDTSAFFALAMSVGTIAGLLIKYPLDKFWIFHDQEIGLKNDGWKFSLYTAVGGLTTIISWSAEAASWSIWRTELMRDLGAVIGLTIGYMVKYQLDKRVVFADRQLRIAP
ncbi:GtrA family protein [Sinorhizobium saheli]|uniref:Polysaccharide biosynthesis protein GtrA n=1 Tax=Sinorhizobium saheli TaxID=36856 RepID=A0A178YSZ2_SINSA|nr:GtrA family protein [Sinorhizobium saheli]MQW86421.1 GtrA family protein [Sinorhizobium saheli]OAP50497.1 polysaccharide biosynthesis protein GtrA [Sinorhizobium saheli]